MFITIEGGEGGGKSTNMAFIQQYLESANQSVVVTREPGGTALGEKIRDILLDPDHKGMDASAELLLMFAARAQHIEKIIRPALAQGQWVLCDRFTDATFAYQGGGRGIDMQRIAALENWVQGDLRPDITLLFDLPVNVGMERAGKRAKLDRFEREKREFFERIRACYLSMAVAEPKRYSVLNAEKSLTEVQNELRIILDKVLEK